MKQIKTNLASIPGRQLPINSYQSYPVQLLTELQGIKTALELRSLPTREPPIKVDTVREYILPRGHAGEYIRARYPAPGGYDELAG